MSHYEDIIKEDLIRCHVTKKADIRFTDGALPHVAGVTNIQIMRSTQKADTSPEGLGWTYAHAPNIAYFNGEFLVQYLANPVSEHEGHTRVFFIRSSDGHHFGRPIEIFPAEDFPTAPYNGEGKENLHGEMTHSVIHQRMSFYLAKNGKMLAMAYYGISPTDPRLTPELPKKDSVKTWDMTDISLVMPGSGYGVGRAIREINPDFSFGPIYFLRYDSSGGYNKDNVDNFPFFEESDDVEFKQACYDLLANRCVTQQWWEEERFDSSGFFTLPPGEAPCIYTLPGDGNDKICIMKNALVSESHDAGESWTDTKRSYSLETSTGKVWGQKVYEGKYVLAYNPTTDTAHRWPLAVTEGNNGQDFGDIYSVLPVIPICRYSGRLKNLGPQYIRGIGEYNPRPEENAFYLTYSNNKEDIWVSRISVPLRTVESQNIDETMSSFSWNDIKAKWNLMIPSWGGIELRKGALELWDDDPYTSAIAERLFKPSSYFVAETVVSIESSSSERGLAICFQDESGREPAKIILHGDGYVNSRVFGSELHLISFTPGEKINCKFNLDCIKNEIRVTISVGDKSVTKRWHFDTSVWSLSRIQFRTKYIQQVNDHETYPKWGDKGNLEGADDHIRELRGYIYSLKINDLD